MAVLLGANLWLNSKTGQSNCSHQSVRVLRHDQIPSPQNCPTNLTHVVSGCATLILVLKTRIS
eukprot:2959981-Amphidinium_carterae.1